VEEFFPGSVGQKVEKEKEEEGEKDKK
jgi:hypothetical protein